MEQDEKETWLDRQTLKELKETLGSDSYAELLKDFFGYCEESSLALDAAFAAQDFTAMESIAHNIKSTSLVYGLKLLSEEAKELENYSRNQDIAKITEIYNNLTKVRSRSLEILKAEE